MRKRGRRSKKPNKEIFMTMYNNESMEIQELANFYGVSKSTIYNWAYQFRNEDKNLSDKQIVNRMGFKKRNKLA